MQSGSTRRCVREGAEGALPRAPGDTSGGERPHPHVRPPQLRHLALRASTVHAAAPVGVLAPLSGNLSSGPGSTHRLHVRSGDLLVVRAGETVSLRTGEATELLHWHADPGWTLEAARLLGLPNPRGGTDLLVEPAGTELAREGLRLLVESHLAVRRGESAAPAAQPSRGFSSQATPAVALLELVARACTAALDAGRGSVAGARRRAALVRAVAELDPSDPDLSLGMLARRMGLSERQTSRLFQREMGVSFRGYVLRARVERACKRLAMGDDPVTEVAYASGWRSLSQFYSTFRREVGMTPALYRARYGATRAGLRSAAVA